MVGGESEKRKVVVVVGGGVAGALLAKNMQFDADVVLIDPKEYFEIPWACLRSMVEPSFAERILINHTDYLSNGRIITSRATGITESEVFTEDGQTILYDYLVLATGHADPTPRSRKDRLEQFQQDPTPRSRKDRLEQFQQDNATIKSSSSVLIIGGGRMGVELAGEISVDYPEKKVTLIHKGPRLLEFIGAKASNKALKWLKLKGVDVLLEQSVDLDSITEGERVFTTSAGKSVSADCHFVCVGRPLGSTWLQETFLKESLDKSKRLMVDKNLRVKGRRNIFAIGDITDIHEIKLGYLAQDQAAVVAKNLKLLLKGGRESKLATYKPAPAMAVVSLGRKRGVAQLPFTAISGRLPGMFKSKDLFVGRTRKMMGVGPRVV
ncbi:apoptosis-inducing factor homolog B-like isoform X2 [Phoenix dactylifera]|uniref:Apoptosis-inducing factor homolog B-like isoform X2 n=1 Tax=Phoenix dactylifera TaxID=42345 RepID=A0A8B9AE14_PHODC|nr:apoptosis-inducing factor homolog B-like isoform X2 [Phoenix dactylifera]